jgi:Kinesin motor domain.
MADISSSLIMDEPALTHMERPAERTMVHSPPHIKNVAALDDDDALSPGIVQSPQKNVSPLPMKKVRMSPLVKTATFNKRPLETPPRMGKSLDNQFDSQKSKRPKMISPFSPTARKLRLKQQSSSSSGGTAMTQQLQQLSSQLKWSMAPSRKVSILVNVSPRLDAPLSSNDEESRLCLYPNVAVEDSGNVHQSSLGYSPARSVRSSYSVTSHASILRKASPGQEVILVNPNAFGDVIPTAVTVETARVVQQFSNKVSEDWVRKYRFDEVCWPDVKQLIGIKKQNTNATMEDISKATVADVVDCKSSVLFGYGIRHSGRLESMFGYIAGEKMDSLRVSVGRKSVGLELGLLGLIVSKLLEKNTSDQGKSVLVQLSMVEILDEDVLKDLLESPSNKASNIVNKSVRIRHPDNKGAILENVTELNIKSLSDVKNAIKKAFHSKYNMKERQMVGGRGHVIATLRVFLNDDDNTANKERKGYNHPMIQLIDLACAETDCMDREAVTGRTKLEINRILNRRVAGIRKSMAGLGAILRRLVVNEVRDLPQSSMYRSSTLTKLIQRALDHVSSRALMISTVCPRRDSYRRTLHTLNYMHRLLVKPSKTAESPFEGKSYELDGHSVGTFNFFSPGDHSIANSAAYSVASSVASEAIRSEFAHAKGSREFMKSLVTDPRQRLATLLSPKDSPIDVASPGIPMAEITTINEVENDNVDDSTNEHVKDDDTTSLHAHDSDPLDASLPEKHNVDVSPDKLSALSDEITFGDSREEALDASFQDDMAHAGHNDATFDKVLEQLDEIDTYNENEDSDCLISGIESFTENTDSPPKSNESVEGHTSGGLDDELKESHPSISKQSDDFSSNDSYKPQEELIADNSKSATQTKASKPDPTGILYDELSKSSRKKSDASSNLHKRHNMVTGISSRDLALAVDDHYASDQSPVSTLTPYDVTTREDEAGTYREKASSMSTEESFPLNPRNRGVAGTSSFQESNYGSDDVQTQTSEPEQGHNSVDQRYHGPDCIPEERTKGKDNVTSYGNLRDSKPKDSLKALIARSQGGDVSSETSNRKSSDQGSDPETSSRREFDDDLDSTRYKTPSGLNSSLNIAKDIESVTLSNDGDCVRGDGNVPSRNTTNDSGDIVAEASENCTSGLPLAGKNDAGDAEKNLSIISNKSEMPRTSIHGSGDDQKRIVVELRKPNAIAVGNESPVASSKELLSDYDQKIKKEASADVAENIERD